MSKRYRKLKQITVSSEIRQKARYVYTSWDEALQEHAQRRGTTMPPELKSDTKPLSETSLAAAICVWVEEQGEDFESTWGGLLEKIPTSRFLQKGYGQLKDPNLAWLFTTSSKGRGIERVLDGAYDHWKGGRFSGPEEGI